MRNEIGAALGPAGMHNEPACDVIKRAHHGHFLGLPRRRYTQIGAAFGPCTRQIGGDASAPSLSSPSRRTISPGLGAWAFCAAEAGAQRARCLSRDRCRLPSACAVAAGHRKFFFAAPWKSWRWPDIDEFALFDLGDEAWGLAPGVCTVRHGGASSNGTQTRSAASGLHQGGGPAYTLALIGLRRRRAAEIAGREAELSCAQTRNNLGDPPALVQPSRTSSDTPAPDAPAPDIFAKPNNAADVPRRDLPGMSTTRIR